MSAQSPDTGKEVVITRTFAAPRDVVWKAFTESERLARWWGPKGTTIDTCTMDLRPGGLFHYCLRSPDGAEMWGRFVYREIDAPDRLVFVLSFSDMDGGITRAPFDPEWPLELLMTITFEAQDGKTAITLRGIALNANALERAAFEAGHASMQEGFAGTWDRLDEYLAKTRA